MPRVTIFRASAEGAEAGGGETKGNATVASGGGILDAMKDALAQFKKDGMTEVTSIAVTVAEKEVLYKA